MNIPQLREQLNTNVVELTFEKADGSMRVALATMQTDYLPKPKETKNPSMSKPTPSDNILFWDIDSGAFRSCKEERVISWVVV